MRLSLTNMIISGFLLAWIIQAVYHRFFAATSVTCDVYDDGCEDTPTLFVHLAGFIGDGYTQIENIVPTFLERGDLVTVHYDGRLGKRASKFDTELVVRKTAAFVAEEMNDHGYTDLVFVGTSMGGKLSHRIAQVLHHEYGIESKAILIDAPLSRNDLQPFMKVSIPFLASLPYTPFLGTLMTVPGLRWILMFFLVPPPNKKLVARLSAEDKKAFLRSVKEARKIKPFFASGEAAMIMKQIAASYPNPWRDGDVVYVRSEEDNDIVVPGAHDSWVRFLGFSPLKYTIPGAGHCAYGLQPNGYREALPWVFDYLRL